MSARVALLTARNRASNATFGGPGAFARRPQDCKRHPPRFHVILKIGYVPQATSVAIEARDGPQSLEHIFRAHAPRAMAASRWQHLPDSIFAVAWTEAVRDEWKIPCKAFYMVRKHRGIASITNRGAPSKVMTITPTRKGLAKALANGEIKDSTYKNCRKLLPGKLAGHSGGERQSKRGKLRVLYNVTLGGMNVFLAQFLASMAFAREFARVRIDPLQRQIRWHSASFTVKDFQRILSAVNFMAKGRPSMYKAIFGGPHESLHCHNWWLQDDAWFRTLRDLTGKWISWSVSAATIVQLISFACVFNGKDVLEHLRAYCSPSDLPIRHGQMMTEMWGELEAFLSTLLAARKIRSQSAFARLYTTRAKTAKRPNHGAPPRNASVKYSQPKRLPRLASYLRTRPNWVS